MANGVVKTEPSSISSLRAVKVVITGHPSVAEVVNETIAVRINGNMQGAHISSEAAGIAETITVNDDDLPIVDRDLLSGLGVVAAGGSLNLDPSDLNDRPVNTKQITIKSGATVLPVDKVLTIILYWRGYGN